MWTMPQQPSVLDRRRLTFFAVGDDNRTAATTSVVEDGARLDRQWERRAATAEQPGQIDLVEELGRVVEHPISAGVAVLGVALDTVPQ